MTEPEMIEHRDVLIVGAGLSGIGAAHHVQAAFGGKTYAILEARDRSEEHTSELQSRP